MNFSEVDKGISTYKTYFSEFLFRWPEVRSFLRPRLCIRQWGKCCCDFSESTNGSVLFISRYFYIRPLSMTRMQFDPKTSPLGYSRSYEVTSVFLPLTFYRIYRVLEMIPMCFSCTDASTDMQYDLLGPTRGLT